MYKQKSLSFIFVRHCIKFPIHFFYLLYKRHLPVQLLYNNFGLKCVEKVTTMIRYKKFAIILWRREEETSVDHNKRYGNAEN